MLFLIASTVPFRRLSFRLGYFADQVTTETMSLDGVTEVAVNTKDCIVYLLENTESQNEIKLYVSAPRVTDIDTTKDGSVQKISIQSEENTVRCYVEIKMPGGVNIPKLKFNSEGDRIQDLVFYDYKDGSTWNTPLIIGELEFIIDDSFPNIIFDNEHEVTTLTVSGSYCVCNFHKLKITTMNFDVTLGSLSVIQNSEISANKVTVNTPLGTHCVAGATVNSVDSASCPNRATRDAGITATYIDASTYCTSELYVCSDSAGSCPASGTGVTAGQGSFTISLDDGPVQVLVDGSTTTASASFIPTFDTFSVTSQQVLKENKDDFSTEPEDPRIYLYETVSPGYTKMWTHSSLKQYIQARPWLISLLSLNLLRPAYHRDTLIHIPGGVCPYGGDTSVKTNTLVSEKLKELSFMESKHLVSAKSDTEYHKYVLTAENEYIREKISFLGDNILIWVCLIVSLIIAIFSVFSIFLLAGRLQLRVESLYKKHLEKARNFSATKKQNQGDQNMVNCKADEASYRQKYIGKLTYSAIYYPSTYRNGLVHMQETTFSQKA